MTPKELKKIIKDLYSVEAKLRPLEEAIDKIVIQLEKHL